MLVKGITLVSAAAAAAVLACGLVNFWQALLVFLGIDLGLMLLVFLYVVVLCSRVDLSKPQEHDDPFFRRVLYIIIDALIILAGVRLRTSGLEKTPKEGRFLLVCNHLALADPAVILHCFQQSQLAFVTKQENQALFLVNKFMHKIMCQNLNRENNREGLKTILRCIQLIKDDEVSMAIFPEGKITLDGRLGLFRAGAFKIAQKANVPIVVCTLKGTENLFPNMLHLRPTKIELNLLDVIPAEEVKSKTTVQISDEVYEIMIANLGEALRVPKGEENP